MSNKVLIIIISMVIVVALVPIVIVIFAEDPSAKKQETSLALPQLTISLSTEEPEQEVVTITAKAEIDDEQGIKSITLPDKSEVEGDEATVEVSENGEYEFTATAQNGQTTTEKIEIKNITIPSGTNPYIPLGFNHTSGDPGNGYIIQDERGNEYVWVPVESGQLISKTSGNSDYEEKSKTVTELKDSVAKYFGFYIARYEASSYESDGQIVAASIGNKMPWINVKYDDARVAATNSGTRFGYENAKTALINSLAWDTTLDWIDSGLENYSTNTSYGNYSGEVVATGATVTDTVNHICDLSGNVKEWTTEKYTQAKTARVTRGGHARLGRTASSHAHLDESTMEATLGFRMILYKQ